AQLDAQARARAAAAKKVAVAAAEKRARLRSSYVRPAGGPVTSGFGQRWGRLHAGIDFGAAYGSPIRAVTSGEVVDSGFDAGGYGNFVHVQHADGTVTTYNHMSRVLRRGGTVDAGDVLGLVGSTGHSTGPHLHFEVRIGGSPIDPAPWLRDHGIGL
ncbi:MAG: mepA, partial [Frankiales bacterium]|nr:mepA [Frankiales bacterium]